MMQKMVQPGSRKYQQERKELVRIKRKDCGKLEEIKATYIILHKIKTILEDTACKIL